MSLLFFVNFFSQSFWNTAKPKLYPTRVMLYSKTPKSMFHALNKIIQACRGVRGCKAFWNSISEWCKEERSKARIGMFKTMPGHCLVEKVHCRARERTNQVNQNWSSILVLLSLANTQEMELFSLCLLPAIHICRQEGHHIGPNVPHHC